MCSITNIGHSLSINIANRITIYIVSECCNGSRKSVFQGLGISTRVLLFLVSCAFPSFLLSVSLSFCPSSCNKTFKRDCRLTHSERITRSSRHRAFLHSRDLTRICIRANWLLLVRDLTLNMVLGAAIPVSRFHSIGQTCPCALLMSRYVASNIFTYISIFLSTLLHKQNFLSLRLVAILKLKSPSCPTIYSWLKGE